MQLARFVLAVHILMGLVLVVQHYQMDLFDPCGMHIVVSLEVACEVVYGTLPFVPWLAGN